MSNTMLIESINKANLEMWLKLADIARAMHDKEKALYSFENVLRYDPNHVKSLHAASLILMDQCKYSPAIGYLKQIIHMNAKQANIWMKLAYCLLMVDDLQASYTAYHQALFHSKDEEANKDFDAMEFWYGIAILYEKYGQNDYSIEAFSTVLENCPNFYKRSEIIFRYGMIQKKKKNYNEAMNLFQELLDDPPFPLEKEDIYLQIGHLYELENDLNKARKYYLKGLEIRPYHATLLRQAGYLHTLPETEFFDLNQAIAYLRISIEFEPGDSMTWYLLGRCYMKVQKYEEALKAYQAAVFSDGNNPVFWCSIGVLYYQINQHRDALRAFIRAIRINPNMQQVWYNLGTLYEAFGQNKDGIDAYQRASKLNPSNELYKKRIHVLMQRGQQGNHPNEVIPLPETHKRKREEIQVVRKRKRISTEDEDPHAE